MHVLVTGANGHVGYNLCHALVERGHRVRASVRNAEDPAKTAPVRALGVAEVVGLDVQHADEFAKAAEGVDLLFHVAASYATYTGSAARDAEIIADSVRGSENALRASAKAGVKTIVMTSSVVTLPLPRSGEERVTEAGWRSDLSLPYFRAKTEAERNAWRLAADFNLKLCTILPGNIGGPGFLRSTPTIDMFDGIVRGTARFGVPKFVLSYVDVRDVVSAHILAAETGAAGRYIVCNDNPVSLLELARAMRRIDPSVPNCRWSIPDFALGALPLFDWMYSKVLGTPRIVSSELVGSMRGKVWNFSNDRAKRELGWKPEIPLARSLAEMMDCMRALRAATHG